ncbi:ATP-binding cassette domain-containing protein [Ornithinibacillus sp. 4-3]|uniref:ATP-binding cassette domain-containing protein n=1 Tax=Ornithinibacillus sp. 4-3 TaxID=3231488 RepID=A0AB39HS39_9BACI
MSVIECKNLTKVYKDFRALDELNCTINEKTITGLIGRNGAGKTTLLKILAGYLSETSGEVHVFSERPYNNLFVSANSILIDDQVKFSNSLTLMQILEEAERFYEHWDMEFAKRLCNYFSFPKNQHHQFLSKGRKSTFNAIIGLASRCELTMFDEPITGMDAAVRKDFYRALLKDYLEHPRTIILSSHHLDEIEDLLEDVLLIKNGQAFLHLPVEDLKEYAVGLTGRTEVVQQWMYDKEVLYKNQISPDYTYVVVKNNFPIEKAKQLGIEVSSVSPSDVCIYLTNETKGGIDDVFSKN